MQNQYCAPCLLGVEGILADELRRMGAKQVQAENAKVFFEGDYALMARANLLCRTAERILLVLGQFRAVTFEELFNKTRALPWENWIGREDRFPVKGWSLESALHSVPDCQSIIKKAVVERLKSVYRVPWFSETGALFQIRFSIYKDRVVMTLDTSGAGLHKRGYRAESVGAPIKETLAAAIVDVTRARLARTVMDPCCGSGTLLIESALAARRIAPGILRRFASMDWACVPKEIWQQERQAAREAERLQQQFTAVGGDIDAQAVALTLANAEKAQVGAFVTAQVSDLKNFRPQGDNGVVLCNPPYGERLLDKEQAEEMIRLMGKVFVPDAGWRYAIISPHEEFEQLFGRSAQKRRKLYNGMLKCCLYMY